MSVQNIYNKLMSAINNPYGVCGLMGNLYAESALKSTNLQNSFNTKLGLSDEDYTAKVDNGTYKNFVHDSAGYGLAQWTYWSRKQNLLDYANKHNESIGNESMQVDFLINEIKGYKTTWDALVNAKSIKDASDAVLTQYERPADQSDAVKNKRAEYGNNIYDEIMKGETNMGYSRQKVVDLVKSWDGKNEADGSYKSIIDEYNKVAPFPRSTKMLYGWAWCACTWSALAKKLGYAAIMPIEISCYYLIEEAKKMGCWQENDAYVPSPGDAILYDWDDNGVGDNKGTPDHVGTVVEVYPSAGYMVVEEGNYSNSVKKRTVSINGKFIRGFITPKYTDNTVSAPSTDITGKSIDTLAHEVIAGKYGSGDVRKKALGDKYNEVQKRVNEILNGSATKPTNIEQPQTQPTEKKVTATCGAQKFDKSLAGAYKTTADLYMRNDAGTNKKALVVIPKGTEVRNYGYYSVSGSTKWLYIQVKIDGVTYTGFSSSTYLKKQ